MQNNKKRQIKNIVVDTAHHVMRGQDNVAKGDTCIVWYRDAMRYTDFTFGVIEDVGYDDNGSVMILFSKIHKQGTHCHFETKNNVLYLCYNIRESEEWFSMPLYNYEEDEDPTPFEW